MKQLACQFRLLLRFFGLKPSDTLVLHQNIFYFIHENPGFTYDNVYNMPVHLRNLYYRESRDFVKKKNDEMKKTQSQQPKIPRRFNPKK